MWFSGRGLSAFGGYALRAALSAKGRYAPLFFVWRPVPHVFRFFCGGTSPPCFSFFLCGGTSPPTPPEMRTGNMATPCSLFAFHEVVRLGALWRWSLFLVFGDGISYLAERFVGIGGHFVFGRAFRGYWWAFRVWPSVSWVLVGISCLAEHFVGIGGLFVFCRAFRGFWWAFRVWPSVS